MTTSSAWDSPPEDFEIDGSGTSSDDLGGGGNVDREGWYHFEVADVVPELETVAKNGNEKSPAIRFDLLVLESAPGQSPAGSRLFHRVYVAGAGGKPISDGARKGAFRFGLGLGLLREVAENGQSSIVDAATGSPKINLETWKRAKGRQCVAKVEHEKGDGKFGDQYRIPFSRVYQVSDPAVADVPKNAEALKMAGLSSAPATGKPPASKPASGGNAGASNGAAQSNAGSAAASAAGAGASEDFSDL